MMAILYYELGTNGIPMSLFFRLVQEYIESYMDLKPSGASTSAANGPATGGSYFVRGCFVIGLFYLSQKRPEEAKLFLMYNLSFFCIMYIFFIYFL